MFRIAIAFLFAVSFVSFSHASDLPANDAGKHQLIVVGLDQPWFSESTNLAKLKAATAFTEFTPTSPLFKARYESVLGNEFPIVAYLRPDGGIIYFADRHTLPERDKLFDEIKAAHLLAKNAVEAPAVRTADDLSSCPDGNCPIDQPDRKPRLPLLRPARNPFDAEQPGFEKLFNGFVSQTIGNGVTVVFAIIGMGFVLFFFVLLLGAMLLVNKLWK